MVGLRQDIIRFSNNGIPGDNRTRRNVFGLHVSRNPFVSLLRITSDSSLSNATVVCLSGGSSDTMPYFRDRFSKLHKNYSMAL